MSFDETDERDWSSLPSGITHHITEFLPVLDRIRCSTVCSSWYTAISPVQLPSPWFVVPYNDGRCTFGSLTTTSDIFGLTAFPPETLGTGIWIAGSQHGCIVAVDALLNVHIVRFFSGAIKSYKLPPLTTLPELELAVSLNLGDLLPMFNCLFNTKIVFSTPDPDPNDFIALSNICGDIIYTRAGEACWRHIPQTVTNKDVIFHDSKFYSLSDDCKVLAYDFSADTPRITVITEDGPRGLLNAEKYLAFSKTGEILIVFRKNEIVELPEGREKYLTKKCLVMRYQSGKSPKWETVKNLGEECLLLGKNNAIALSAANAAWIRNNCIYFGDGSSTNRLQLRGMGTNILQRILSYVLHEIDIPSKEYLREVVVYDMKSKKITELYPLEFCLDQPAPIWFDI